ncbi:kinase-like domain-containing protein [Hyaloraphidium curvatum]|nr:kinase-like domain-containing protein [Hyaloraphidium curvatum]
MEDTSSAPAPAPAPAPRPKRRKESKELIESRAATARAAVDTARRAFVRRFARHDVTLGKGGYAKVVLAHDTVQNTQVALKIARTRDMLPDSSTLKEAAILRALGPHSAVVRLIEEAHWPVDERGSSAPSCLALELGSCSLQDAIYGVEADSEPGAPPDEWCPVPGAGPIAWTLAKVRTVMSQLLEGLQFIHGKGFLHRDIKPANVLLFPRGVVKYGDFGIACPAPNPFFAGRMCTDVVTLWYRAPELFLGTEEHSYGVDVWSLGCVLGELLFHRPLFQASTTGDMLKAMAAFAGPVPASSNLCRLPSFARYEGALTTAASPVDDQPPFPLATGERPAFDAAVALLRVLLAWDPDDRADIGKMRMWDDTAPISDERPSKRRNRG